MNDKTFYTYSRSPIGNLLLVSNGEELTGLYLEGHRGGPTPGAQWRRDEGPFGEVQEQLEAYFAGELSQFDLSLAPAGTDFQQRVWDELLRIPLGSRATYSELAERIEQPKAVRAVGAATGRNPISIIVPCHRVVGADGRLTGYAGGVNRKDWLLRHEAAVLAKRATIRRA